jgi:hypothetical protein
MLYIDERQEDQQIINLKVCGQKLMQLRVVRHTTFSTPHKNSPTVSKLCRNISKFTDTVTKTMVSATILKTSESSSNKNTSSGQRSRSVTAEVGNNASVLVLVEGAQAFYATGIYSLWSF